MQHKKKISDQASACTQREDKEWKYQQKSVAGGMVCKPSRVQSNKQERRVVASLYSIRKSVGSRKQDEERYDQFGELTGSVFSEQCVPAVLAL